MSTNGFTPPPPAGKASKVPALRPMSNATAKPAPQDEAAQPKPAKTPAPRKPRSRKPAQKASDLPKRMSIHFYGDELNDARSAFVTDWTHLAKYDTFNSWIEAVIVAHCKRTPEQRAKVEARYPAPRERGKQGSFGLTEDTAQAVRDMLIEDQQAGRFVTRSALGRAAILDATDKAKKRNGGTLIAAPSRLPARLGY